MMKKYIDRVQAESRLNKYNQFMDMLKVKPGDSILEVGVANREYSSVDNFLIKNYRYRKNITALGIGDMTLFRQNYPDIKVISYAGTSFPFKNKEFEVAHSNAVIEHVGDLKAQIDFLKEMVRVSRRGMITTPNRYFPIETHTRVPFLHWMRKDWFDLFLNNIGKGWAANGYMRLLERRDLVAIATYAGVSNYRIIGNMFAGFIMTYSLIWFDE